MPGSVNLCIRVDEDVKRQCEDLYREIGVTLSSAINVFMRQSVREGGFPFELKVVEPNKDRAEHAKDSKPSGGSENSNLRYAVSSDGLWGSK